MSKGLKDKVWKKFNLEDVKEVLQAITDTVSKRERLQNPFEYNLTFEYKIEDQVNYGTLHWP